MASTIKTGLLILVFTIGIYWALPWLDQVLVKLLVKPWPSGFEYSTQAECKAVGGDWGRVGLFPKEFCRIPTTDFGKHCWTGWQCQAGICVIQGRPNKPWPINGQCPKYSNIFGCIQMLHFGIPTNVICRD